MIEGISNTSQASSLQRNLYAAKEKAESTQRTQLIFADESPLYLGNRIINERCVFMHPDGRITSIENKERALEILETYNGEIYLPEHLAVEELHLDLEG
jgi:hypothetical protein